MGFASGLGEVNHFSVLPTFAGSAETTQASLLSREITCPMIGAAQYAAMPANLSSGFFPSM